MKIQIRQGVFETNSSSTHAVCIMTDEEYQKYEKGEILISRNGYTLSKEEYENQVEAERQEALKKAKSIWEKYYKGGHYYKTLEDYKEHLEDEPTITECSFDQNYIEFEHAEREVEGVKVHAISTYGYDY